MQFTQSKVLINNNLFQLFYFMAAATCHCCWYFATASRCFSMSFSLKYKRLNNNQTFKTGYDEKAYIFSSVSLELFNSFEMYSMRLPTFWRESSSSCFTSTGPNNLYTLLSDPSNFNSSNTHLFSFS